MEVRACFVALNGVVRHIEWDGADGEREGGDDVFQI